MGRDDTVKSGRSLDTPEIRAITHGFYSNSSFMRHYRHRRKHPYTKGERGYFLEEFKKAKPPTFVGDLDKLEDAKAWLNQMSLKNSSGRSLCLRDIIMERLVNSMG